LTLRGSERLVAGWPALRSSSATSADRDWAQWIAWTLKEAGHTPFVHEWEVGAGESIPA
jgi:hypothetical protein